MPRSAASGQPPCAIGIIQKNAMQNYGLTIDKFLDHAAKWSGDRLVVEGAAPDDTAGADRQMTYAVLRDRSNRLSGALLALDMPSGALQFGDRVGTLAWNTLDHLAIYYATMGVGLVCHTLNPRLTVEHLVAIINQAQDRVLAVAADLLPLAEAIVPLCPCIDHIVVLDRRPTDVQRGPSQPVPVHALDDLIDICGAPVVWGQFDENAGAGLCFTSGTTGRPKGVLYTHRSNYLHTLHTMQANVFALTADDVVLLGVPMFHANGWGLPFSAPGAGAGLVLPGRAMDGASLARLMRSERVTVAVGVQTLWLGLVDHLEATGTTLPALQRVLIGGSTCPDALIGRIEQQLGAHVQTSWGMTELSPLGTVAPAQPGTGRAGGSGRPPVGVDLKLTAADGTTLPEQRGVQGHLKARGASVIDRYFGDDTVILDGEGYFDTGDLATIDTAGNLTICGRAKDLIKSGGEWINPTEMEAIIGRDPAIRHVAVVGRDDAKWGERPVLIVERDDRSKDVRGLLQLLRGQVADWWLPAEVIDIETMPLAASGKIDKARLRADYAAGLFA
jgi:acyl-CoA synthetase (AMP-forming)/AMP-acid ligase II